MTSTTTASFAQGGDVVCYICGKPGHKKPECPDANKIPRNKWHVNKAMSALQGKSEEGDEDADSDNESIKSSASTNSRSARGKKPPRTIGDGWSAYQTYESVNSTMVTAMVHKQTKACNHGLTNMNNVILLDTGSSIGGMFMNPDMVVGI